MTNREIDIKDLGFNDNLSDYTKSKQLEFFTIGRVILEHKERYIVLTETGEIQCELIGNLRFTAITRSDLPVVGDWVAFNLYDSYKGLIHAIYPRVNQLERQAIGNYGEKQLIASNVDYGLIVQSVNRDYSINRLERYITICHKAKIEPIIILSKIDLISPDQLDDMLSDVRGRIHNTPIITLSNQSGQGLQEFQSLIEAGKTYCLLGSSGVGKSTLINSLLNRNSVRTGEISESIDRGKHITTHRELFLLPNRGVIIDNPGMREVGITDGDSGLEMTYEQIHELAQECKFKDCTHTVEKGCKVLEAIEQGELNEDSYHNYMKLQREQVHFTSSVHEKRKKEKAFGKMVKRTMAQKSKNKY